MVVIAPRVRIAVSAARKALAGQRRYPRIFAQFN
jgi:hypothetical protein